MSASSGPQGPRHQEARGLCPAPRPGTPTPLGQRQRILSGPALSSARFPGMACPLSTCCDQEGHLRALGEGKAEATTGDRSTRARPLLPGGGTPAPNQTPMEPGVPVRTRGPPGLTREPRRRVDPAPSPGRPLEGAPQERTSPAREAPCRPVWGRHRVTFHVGSHGDWCPRVPSTESGRRRAHTAWRRRRVGREAGSLRQLIPCDRRQTTPLG